MLAASGLDPTPPTLGSDVVGWASPPLVPVGAVFAFEPGAVNTELPPVLGLDCVPKPCPLGVGPPFIDGLKVGLDPELAGLLFSFPPFPVDRVPCPCVLDPPPPFAQGLEVGLKPSVEGVPLPMPPLLDVFGVASAFVAVLGLPNPLLGDVAGP